MQSSNAITTEIYLIEYTPHAIFAVHQWACPAIDRDMKLKKHLVDKPWGRTDISAEFGTMSGRRVGEIWYSADTEAPLPVLVKWLFTPERLSIQAHPDDAQATHAACPQARRSVGTLWTQSLTR